MVNGKKIIKGGNWFVVGIIAGVNFSLIAAGIVVVIAFGITSCKKKSTKDPVRSAPATIKLGNDPSFSFNNSSDFTRDGMHYIMYKFSNQGGIVVVNLTKDSLEVAAHRKQLSTQTE